MTDRATWRKRAAARVADGQRMRAELPYLSAAVDCDFDEACTGACSEMRALLNLHQIPFSAVKVLDEMGVPRILLAQLCGAGDLILANVDLSGDGSRFDFGGPTRRLILAVRAHGVLIDMVALSSTHENEWALYRGDADFMGDDLIDRAIACEWRELRLFSTPMAWLRGGGRGVCVLDWNRHALGALRGLGAGVTLVVDAGAKAKLQAMLTHGGLPLVAEDRPAMVSAA